MDEKITEPIKSFHYKEVVVLFQINKNCFKSIVFKQKQKNTFENFLNSKMREKWDIGSRKTNVSRLTLEK
jgi:hypothetical protein